MNSPSKKLGSALTVAASLISSAAFADSITWTGAVNNEWNETDANWTGDDTIYADGDDVLFDDTASGEIATVVDRSPNSTTVDSDNKVTFATGILNGNSAVVGGPSILSGPLIKNGAGELELGDPGLGQQFGANKNQYSNNFSSVTVNAGTLRIRSRAALGSGTVTLAGGTIFKQSSEEARYGFGNEHIDNDFVLSGGLVEFPMSFGDTKGVWIRNGIVSGTGGIRITGSGRAMALSGDNTYSGGTMIDTNGGAGLTIGSYTALGTGTLTTGQNQITSGNGGGLVAGLELSGNATYPDGVTNPILINAGKFLNVFCNQASATLRLSGTISGDGALNKWKNDSTVILSGTNTYTGGTHLLDGTIVCENESALGTGPITMALDTILQLDFVGSINVTSLTLDGSPVADGTYGSSSSPAENPDNTYFSGPGMITVGPPKTATTTALAQTAGTNPTDIGLSVTLTATVSGGTPTGTVVFYDGITELGSDTLDGSYEASISTTELPEGIRNVVAQYQGDASYASSTSSALAIQVVDSRTATTTALALTSGSNPSASGDSLSYTVTVSGDAATGTVHFYDRDNLIDSVALDGSFQASVTTSDLGLGRRLITAQYDGDVGNKPSSDAYAQNVNAPAGNGKLKVFILAGQSNMQGHGKTEMGRDPEDLAGSLIRGGIGSLRGAANRDPLVYGYLLDEDNLADGLPGFITRDDVYLSYWDTVGGSTGLKREGYLDSFFGVATDNRIGPEYGFGHAVGAALGDDVLIIKTAWGGKSLYVDFRPPSSGGTVGPYYTDMVEKVNLVLDNLATYYPDYNGSGYELVGFGWHQGWNDRVNGDAVAEYEANMVNLINDIRTEFSVPDLPFVIANTGLSNAPSGPGTLIEAQGNVSDPELYPGLAGTVTTVDTRPFDYGIYQSPINQGYHWNGNGESYYQIGEAMGAAMLELLESVSPGSPFSNWASDPGQGLTPGLNDGPLDDPDFDGMVNLVEFVLNGDPLASDNDRLPTLSKAPGNWVFAYTRNNDSSPGVSQTVEYTSNFDSWTQVPIPETSAGIVTITPGAESADVSVALPDLGPKGFARLLLQE